MSAGEFRIANQSFNYKCETIRHSTTEWDSFQFYFNFSGNLDFLVTEVIRLRREWLSFFTWVHTETIYVTGHNLCWKRVDQIKFPGEELLIFTIHHLIHFPHKKTSNLLENETCSKVFLLPNLNLLFPTHHSKWSFQPLMSSP